MKCDHNYTDIEIYYLGNGAYLHTYQCTLCTHRKKKIFQEQSPQEITFLSEIFTSQAKNSEKSLSNDKRFINSLEAG